MSVGSSFGDDELVLELGDDRRLGGSVGWNVVLNTKRLQVRCLVRANMGGNRLMFLSLSLSLSLPPPLPSLLSL